MQADRPDAVMAGWGWRRQGRVSVLIIGDSFPSVSRLRITTLLLGLAHSVAGLVGQTLALAYHHSLLRLVGSPLRRVARQMRRP